MSDDMWAFVRPDILLGTSVADHQLLLIEKLEELQREAREGIQRVLEGKWFHLRDGIRYGIALDGDRIIKGAKIGEFDDHYRAAVMDTLQAFWEQLRACPRCQAIFLKVGKQKYCSPTCANRAAWDAFKKRGRTRDYRREYAGRTQKRLGPLAKVKIKPRGSK